MPSSDEICEARTQVKQWAIEALINEGHPEHSAKAMVEIMNYDQRLAYAEKVCGSIYKGAYSPY
jgi:hypothetical protein